MSKLAIVRRLEAVGFRAWPAASTHYDGSWLIRQTAGHPSKRLNSVNPLDPSDHDEIEARIQSAARRFRAYDRPMVFRQTPLAPRPLDEYFDMHNWRSFGETSVMMLDIHQVDLSDAVDQIPVQDVGWYVDASIQNHGHDGSYKAGLTEIVSAIEPQHGMFVIEQETGQALSSVLCVKDKELAGVFNLCTRNDFRGHGHAKALLKSILLWARQNGARKAWLQVEKDNLSALGLYHSFGFREIYSYSYRMQP